MLRIQTIGLAVYIPRKFTDAKFQQAFHELILPSELAVQCIYGCFKKGRLVRIVAGFVFVPLAVFKPKVTLPFGKLLENEGLATIDFVFGRHFEYAAIRRFIPSETLETSSEDFGKIQYGVQHVDNGEDKQQSMLLFIELTLCVQL